MPRPGSLSSQTRPPSRSTAFDGRSWDTSRIHSGVARSRGRDPTVSVTPGRRSIAVDVLGQGDRVDAERAEPLAAVAQTDDERALAFDQGRRLRARRDELRLAGGEEHGRGLAQAGDDLLSVQEGPHSRDEIGDGRLLGGRGPAQRDLAPQPGELARVAGVLDGPRPGAPRPSVRRGKTGRVPGPRKERMDTRTARRGARRARARGRDGTRFRRGAANEGGGSSSLWHARKSRSLSSRRQGP